MQTRLFNITTSLFRPYLKILGVFCLFLFWGGSSILHSNFKDTGKIAFAESIPASHAEFHSSDENPFHSSSAVLEMYESNKEDVQEEIEHKNQKENSNLVKSEEANKNLFFEQLKTAYFTYTKAFDNRQTASLFLLHHSWKNYLS